MYLNEYALSKNITLYTIVLVFKIVERLGVLNSRYIL